MEESMVVLVVVLLRWIDMCRSKWTLEGSRSLRVGFCSGVISIDGRGEWGGVIGGVRI